MASKPLPISLPNVFMANADDLITPTLHYNNAGTMTLGNRYGEGFAAIMSSRMHGPSERNWRKPTSGVRRALVPP